LGAVILLSLVPIGQSTKAQTVRDASDPINFPNSQTPPPPSSPPAIGSVPSSSVPSSSVPSSSAPSGQGGSSDSPLAGDANTGAAIADNAAASEVAVAEADERLTLADVIASVYRSYPEIARARLEANRTQGEITGAYGAFDTKLQAYSLSEPTGFYRNFRNGIGVARQTWWGGYLSAGYRLGRGDFQPWYKERETNEGGEFKLALGQALLQGRAIDAARVEVFQANIARRAADPILQQAILQTSRDAAAVYWQWVAAGNVLEAQRELLELAETRGKQYEIGVKADKFAEIDLILNRQLIAERKAKQLETEQKFRATSFKLSLFLRNEVGQPMVPDDAWLPSRFPIIQPPPPGDFQQDLANALARRPEPRLLMFEVEQLNLDRQLACNNLLPSLDLIAEASQDVGIPASSSNDKGQFELVVGFQGEVPIQRRKARGKIQSTTAKISQVTEKLRLQRDKIGAELMAAYNALMLAAQVVEQNEISLRAALDTLGRYRFAFDRGYIDLIYLNLLETKANETEIKLVEAQQLWFSALAEMQVALGLDPLDQAMLVTALPPSEIPGPGKLPEFDPLKPDELNSDWERHVEPKKD
jgi:outer membrane protein TolC